MTQLKPESLKKTIASLDAGGSTAGCRRELRLNGPDYLLKPLEPFSMLWQVPSPSGSP
jgi:hypothetical protein